MLLVVCGVGFVPHHGAGVTDCLWGAMIGFGVMMAISILSRMIYKRPGVGGADVKLFAALGLCLGTKGILTVFLLTTFLSAGHFTYLMARRGAKLTDERAMVPYIAISATIYMVILREMSYNIMIQF
ncbi:MAG: prepilin peptidase, partial [Firmicutes bacterium]|nr:prepilin peptidase [Bacillota bacterium]